MVAGFLTAGALGCAGGHAPSADPKPETAGASGRSLANEGTGAVSVVDGSELEGRPAVHFQELLEGRISGVQVIRTPNGGIAFRIRGISSLYGDNEPLYVVDGMPVHVTPGRGLEWLNPADIARVEVLKDASTTSMYGVRGANGVVLITTRRGKS
jgi:TonB-dependent SusC/RagA subfamily outer membrane receptor